MGVIDPARSRPPAVRAFRGAHTRWLLLLLAACLLLALANVATAHEPTVFAASSLTDAMRAAGQDYTAKTGRSVDFSFASSSTLARQIVEGAPADVFVSADKQWMHYVAEKQRIEVGSRVQLVTNALVLIAPADADIQPMKPLSGAALVRALGNGPLAMGHPGHVPAGIYGKQALRALDAWQNVRDRVARAANVRAALALVARGGAPLGIVYRTDARASDKVKTLATFPPDSHEPIVYPAAPIRHEDGDDRAARRFLRYLQSARAGRIFAAHGFRTPQARE